MWDNQTDGTPVFDTTCAPLFENCDIQTGSYVATNAGAVFQKCMSLNPLLANDSAGNCWITPNSPCINAGTADTGGRSLPDVDLADKPRVYGSRVDIGAYEFQGMPGSPVVTVQSPRGGEVWNAGTTHNIMWSADDNAAITARSIWLSTDYGAHFTKIDSAASGPFDWTIPATTNSARCLVGIVVYDVNGNSGWGVSDSAFAILGRSSAASVTVANSRDVVHIFREPDGNGLIFTAGDQAAYPVFIRIASASGRELWRYSGTLGSRRRIFWRSTPLSGENRVILVLVRKEECSMMTKFVLLR